VLNRKVGDVLVLHQDGRVVARVMVVEVRGPHVRIGIDAPEFLRVHRGELLERLPPDERPAEEGG
jgi:carbon storage regulator CsrA